MESTASSRDIRWIRGALQTALTLEHGTMPVYAAAMYSLEIQNYPAYNIIRSVLMEEMLHMAAAANMIAALGGRPRIKDLEPLVLSRGLPGQVAPQLHARCARLSRRQLEVFMRIESPAEHESDRSRPRLSDTNGTVGAFYRSIKEAIVANADDVIAAARGPMKANQVGGNLGYRCIDPSARTDLIEQFVAGIDLIVNQGEGTTTSTRDTGPGSECELSHYARFAELRFGRRYIGTGRPSPTSTLAEGRRRWFQGEPLAWPNVINMLAVPDDGYEAILARDPAAEHVRSALDEFDAGYSRMLHALDAAWNGPPEHGWPRLGDAVQEMNELRVVSCFRILRELFTGDDTWP